jgi:hypothetical protein
VRENSWERKELSDDWVWETGVKKQRSKKQEAISRIHDLTCNNAIVLTMYGSEDLFRTIF